MRPFGRSLVPVLLVAALVGLAAPASAARFAARHTTTTPTRTTQLKTNRSWLFRQHGGSHARKADDVVAAEKMRFTDRLTDKLAGFAGSARWLGMLTAGTTAWLAAHNFLGDPELIKLNLSISIVTMLTGQLVLMSQNRAGAIDRARAQEDLEIDKRSEAHLKELHAKIDEMNGQMAIMMAALKADADRPKTTIAQAKK